MMRVTGCEEWPVPFLSYSGPPFQPPSVHISAELSFLHTNNAYVTYAATSAIHFFAILGPFGSSNSPPAFGVNSAQAYADST